MNALNTKTRLLRVALEATALRQRVGGALFTEISDLHTEGLATLALERTPHRVNFNPTQEAV